MPIVAQGGTVTLTARVGHANGNPADDAALTLTILDTLGAPVAGFPVAIPPIVRDDLGAYSYVWAVPALLAIGDYTATWDATVDGADAGGSEQVEVVEPGAILSGTPSTYASLDDVIATFETEPVLPRKIARLASLLGVATSQVIEECGHRDYFQHPATGSATWLTDGDGSHTLHIHGGLVALDGLEISLDGGLSFVAVAASDYSLRGAYPDSAEPVPDGEPYFHLRFTGLGSYGRFPRRSASVRLTGVRGWPAIPTALVEATAQRARQLAFASAGYSGGDAGGPDEYGRISPTDRFWPQSLYNFLLLERSRFATCWM